jgi:surface antigen
MIIRSSITTLSQRLTTKQTRRITVQRLLKKRLGRSRKRLIRYGILSANVALLVAVVGFITYDPTPTTTASSGIIRMSEQEAVRANPLDQLSSADIAVNVALMADLEEAVAVVNQADSVSARMAIAPSDESIAAKPQIVTTELKSKNDIVKHTVQEGETVTSVAQKYGVTSDSVRWSNGIIGDALQVNQDIHIPPVNGIVYTVRSGDTIDSLAERFSANRAQLIADNDAEVAGLVVGERILIRGGRQPAPTPTYSSYSFYNATYGGNGYIYGWCTWHAANRRIQEGRPIPTNLGNAITWYSLAQRAGLPVGNTPRAGAVLWHANIGGLGHVAYVEKINPDGSALVSDMNYPIWGTVTYRTVQPSEFGNYRFIY